jgi:hypothetical protein
LVPRCRRKSVPVLLGRLDVAGRHRGAGRMFTVELYAKIRHAVMIDGLNRREAAKRFGVHRNTITKMLSFSVPPGWTLRPLRAKYGLQKSATCLFAQFGTTLLGLRHSRRSVDRLPRQFPTWVQAAARQRTSRGEPPHFDGRGDTSSCRNSDIDSRDHHTRSAMAMVRRAGDRRTAGAAYAYLG